VEGNLIKCEKICFSYERDKSILTDIDLELHRGLILLLGPNGCGKSTLLRLLAGVEMADSGRILINGTDLWEQEIKARSQLVYVPEYPDLTPYASIKEVMDLVCRLRGQTVEAGADALKKAGVEHLWNRTIRELSNGQRRRAVFACCLVGRASVILLDEPLEGMDTLMRKKILAWLKGRLGDGAVVLVASHTVGPFLPLVDQAVIIRDGQAVHHDKLPAGLEQKQMLLDKLTES
jgi:ABC-type multidrug transport system ATPase subunit